VTHGAAEGSQVLQLLALIAEIQPDDETLDALLADARKLADQMLDNQQRGVTAIPGVMVTALRTFLSISRTDPGTDPREIARQLLAQLEASGVAGLEVLVLAAFTIAARRRFAPLWIPPDVIRYVARVRSDSADMAERLDGIAAENQLRIALGQHITPHPDMATRAEAQIFLLEALTADYADRDLDSLLAEARAMADQTLAATRAPQATETEGT
jgi:hypothetical protein